MNKQQLANKIWESANKMRSKIEANEYKDYILGFIFYKFLSDKEVDFLKKDGSIILFKSPFFDISKFERLDPDFHYNAISMSAIIGGFLFTGISILISVIDKERIERLWNNSYLDNLYRSAFVGMIANVITIIVAFSLVFLDISQKAEDSFLSRLPPYAAE